MDLMAEMSKKLARRRAATDVSTGSALPSPCAGTSGQGRHRSQSRGRVVSVGETRLSPLSSSECHTMQNSTADHMFNALPITKTS